MKSICRIIIGGMLLCLSPILAQARVSLPAIYGDHMVLQQQSTVTIWGWASPFEEVIITNSWSKDTLKTTVGNQARWNLKMNTPKAGRNHTITVQG